MFISLTSSEKVLEINSQLYSPFEVEDSLIFCSFNGEIMKYSEGQLKMFTKINGQIRSIRYDAPKNTYYVTDLLRQSVIAVNSVDATESQLVSEFEGTQLQGPHSLIVSNKTGNIFFTDCGPFGENISPYSRGSLLVIDMQQKSIRAIALKCLCSPTGLAFSHEEKVIYVSETGKNRLLRFFHSPEGIYYMSVFHQFNGRFGPTAISVTRTRLIVVALFEFKSMCGDGSLGFLNEEGEFIHKLKLPQCGPEISGLFISRQTQEDISLLITENSGRPSCHKLTIKIERQLK